MHSFTGLVFGKKIFAKNLELFSIKCVNIQKTHYICSEKPHESDLGPSVRNHAGGPPYLKIV